MSVAFEWLNRANYNIAASAEAIVTGEASTVKVVNQILLHNPQSSTKWVKLYLVPASGGAVGTAADTNQFLEVTLAVNETYPINDISIILHTENDSLQAVCETANNVNMLCFGEVQTS